MISLGVPQPGRGGGAQLDWSKYGFRFVNDHFWPHLLTCNQGMTLAFRMSNFVLTSFECSPDTARAGQRLHVTTLGLAILIDQNEPVFKFVKCQRNLAKL